MKVKLRLKRSHPHAKMMLGKHAVTMAMQEFELDEKEQKELKSKGCQHWFTSVELKKAPVGKPQKKEVVEKKSKK